MNVVEHRQIQFELSFRLSKWIIETKDSYILRNPVAMFESMYSYFDQKRFYKFEQSAGLLDLGFDLSGNRSTTAVNLRQ